MNGGATVTGEASENMIKMQEDDGEQEENRPLHAGFEAEMEKDQAPRGGPSDSEVQVPVDILMQLEEGKDPRLPGPHAHCVIAFANDSGGEDRYLAKVLGSRPSTKRRPASLQVQFYQRFHSSDQWQWALTGEKWSSTFPTTSYLCACKVSLTLQCRERTTFFPFFRAIPRRNTTPRHVRTAAIFPLAGTQQQNTPDLWHHSHCWSPGDPCGS